MVVINTRLLNLYLSVVTHDMTEFSFSFEDYALCEILVFMIGCPVPIITIFGSHVAQPSINCMFDKIRSTKQIRHHIFMCISLIFSI
jgi:hypothetical protein